MGKYDLITMGEMIMRLSPEDGKLFIQDGNLIRQIGGAEYNVAVSSANLGAKVGMLIKIPKNIIGEYAKKEMKKNNISTCYVLEDNSKNKRMPIYYYEYGANPRKPKVTYDRGFSSFHNMNLDEIDKTIFSNCKIFHTSGITLGLSKKLSDLTTEIIKKFKENGTLISFDVNYRANLWSEEEARNSILPLLEYIDILFASEETLRKMFGQTGDIHKIMENFSKKYNIKIIASTKREVISPKIHNFTSIVYSKHNFYKDKEYKNIDIIDRIGSGDAYCGGFLFGFLHFNDIEKATIWGNANSVFKNTTIGDTSVATFEMIENIIKNHRSNNKSELDR